MKSMQNNQSNNNNNLTGNPNYPYNDSLEEDYNQNQFPQDYYQSQPVAPNTNEQNSWHAFTPTDNQNNQPYQTTNNPNSIEDRPESELMVEGNKEMMNQNSAYIYNSPTLLHNNDNNQVFSSQIPVVEANKTSNKEATKEESPKLKTKSGVTGLLITVLILIAIVSIAASSAVAGLVSFYITKKYVDENQQKSSAISEITTTRTTDEQSAIVDAVSVARESVVSVIVSRDRQITVNRDGFFDRFFGDGSSSSSSSSSKSVQVGAGTGFVVSSQGYILTNKHVVEDTKANYSVVLDNGNELKATVLGRDPILDIAILKVDQNANLKAIKLGDSANIKVGQTVIAIGNSLGEFNNSVSRGIVSGLGRTISASSDISKNVETLEGIIQTDASINPGNSGGPLLDVNGFVIGVNVAKSQDSDNIAFSIPINDVKQLLEGVISTGKLQRPYLGVQYVLVNKDIADKEKLSLDYGAYLVSQENGNPIAKDSPASKAGLKDKDIILEINGKKINQENDLRKMVQKFKVGDVLTLKVLREGKEIELKVTLEELKE